MQTFVNNLVENVKKIDRFSIWVLQFGLRLTFGLVLISAICYELLGRYGNYLNAYICAQSALHTAPAMLASTVIAALIGDIAIKDRSR